MNSSPEPSEITIVPFQQLAGLVGQSEGHGIFIDCGGHRMNVGTILPHPDGKHTLTVMIMAEMHVPGYSPCDFTEVYDRFEDAANAAHLFLASQRKETQ